MPFPTKETAELGERYSLCDGEAYLKYSNDNIPGLQFPLQHAEEFEQVRLAQFHLGVPLSFEKRRAAVLFTALPREPFHRPEFERNDLEIARKNACIDTVGAATRETSPR